ncbi:MAG: radical SAM protein [Deltaproteobacteria bacterium]|nr:radical SAM protein [Deltaproteobacteria bacterium]
MVRRIYWDVLKRELIAGRVGWVARATARYLLIHLSMRLGRPLCGPILGTIVTNYRCNYRCEMCDLPSRNRAAAELGTAEMLDLVGQFGALGTLGIGFTGGEPLLRDDVFELIRHTKRLGMIAHLNTNGSLVDGTVADRILESGVDSVNVSLDAPTAAVHDDIRGVEGAFDKAVGALRSLVRCGEGRARRPRLKAVCVLSERNEELVPELLRLAEELGVDCLEVIPRQPFRAGEAALGLWRSEIGSEIGASAVAALERARGGPVGIENSPRMLRLMSGWFAGGVSPLRCFAGYNSLVADCRGNVYPCLPWVNWDRPAVGNVGSSSLRHLWHSEAYQEVRRQTRGCRECTLNCQAELNLLFQRSART